MADQVAVATCLKWPFTVEQAVAYLRANGYRVTIDGCTDAAGVTALLPISERTLRDWNRDGRGPPRVVYSAKVKLFPLAELIGWQTARMHVDGEWRQMAADGGSYDVAPAARRGA